MSGNASEAVALQGCRIEVMPRNRGRRYDGWKPHAVGFLLH